MTVYRKGNNHIILATALVAFILFTSHAHATTTLVKAEFTPPNTADWLGSGETTGIFSSGIVIFNITSGTQYKPNFPRITFHSNTSQLIKLGNCIADFRLLRVEENSSLTETDYARFTLNIINAKEGVFWASRINDYPATYRIGVVIWNASDGAVVGRLIATIQTSNEHLVKMTSDKAEYGPLDEISLTLVNRGPPVDVWGGIAVYRLVNGTRRFVGPSYPMIVDYATWTLGRNETHRLSVGRDYTDFSQSGVYMVTMVYAVSNPSGILSTDLPFPLTSEFRIVGSSVISPKVIEDRSNVVLIGALTGAVVGIAIFYLIRRRARRIGAGNVYSYHSSL